MQELRWIQPERLSHSMRQLYIVYSGERLCVVDPIQSDEARLP